MLDDYEKTLPPQARGSLDFGATPVGPTSRNKLVAAEGGDIAEVTERIHELGGANPNVTQTPILLRNNKGEFGTGSLFEVQGTDGKNYLVDSLGAKYTDIHDYLESNKLDESWTITRPANLGDPNAAGDQLITTPAHTPTTWQKVRTVGDKIAAPLTKAGLVLMGTGLVTSAAGGVGAPLIPIGGAMAAVGGGWAAIRGSVDLFDRYQHGRTISPLDEEARADWLAAGSALPGAGGALTRGAKPALSKILGYAGYGLGAAAVADQVVTLHNDWSRLTPGQKAERLGQVAATTGLLAIPGVGRGLRGTTDEPLTAERIQHVYGMPSTEQRQFQSFADRYGYIFDVRPSNIASLLDRLQGTGLPKPETVKAKTINNYDEMLQPALTGQGGRVGYFNPGQLPPRGNLSDTDWTNLAARYNQRKDEYATLQEKMAKLTSEGDVKIDNGVVYGRAPDGTWKPYVGDNDIFAIRYPSGNLIPRDKHDEIISEMREADMGVQHGGHMFWDHGPQGKEMFDKIFKSHGLDGEPLIRFAPNSPTSLVDNAGNPR